MRAALTMIAAAAIAASTATPAQAQRPCQDRSSILEKLSKDFDETPVAIGMAANGGVLEVLAARTEKDTFTIIVTMPNGVSCMLASGRHFEMIQGQTTAQGDPV